MSMENKYLTLLQAGREQPTPRKELLFGLHWWVMAET